MSQLHQTTHVESAILIQVVDARMQADQAADSLLELARLADTAGLKVINQLTQKRDRPDGATLIGSGKLKDLENLILTTGANVVIADNPLSAFQAFNLAKALNIRVMDRTEVILEIFARRARSAEAQVQVELAQTRFLLSRIPVTESQQRFKGAANVRGPGESHLQLRNVPLRRRITELKKKLVAIQKRQETLQSGQRQWPMVSLVGYTNAGKSTLLNKLTAGDAYVDDRLFATLDTKSRGLWLGPGREALLTDTVGFIRNLPHGLVASFKSTLSVAVRADLLLVVVDASHPHVLNQIEICYSTLREIEAGQVPHLLVFNKCDTATSLPQSAATALQQLTARYPEALPVSAQTGYGLELLKRAIRNELQKSYPLWQLPPAF